MIQWTVGCQCGWLAVGSADTHTIAERKARNLQKLHQLLAHGIDVDKLREQKIESVAFDTVEQVTDFMSKQNL